jgi:hypothetical protein
VTEPVEEPVRETARGQDEATPARVLFGVALTVWLAAGVLIAALLLLWWFLAR